MCIYICIYMFIYVYIYYKTTIHVRIAGGIGPSIHAYIHVIPKTIIL